MRRVLYITTVSRTINAFLIPHIEMLLSKGYKVDCACNIDKPIDKKLLAKGVKIYEVPFSRNPLGLGNIKAFSKLKDIQRINKYDVIHVHTPIAAIYGRLLKLFFPKVKTIYTAHGYHFLKGGPLIGWLLYYPIEKIMAGFTDVTININKEDYDITKNKLKPRSSYLLNGVGLELDKYKKLSKEKTSEKRVELGFKEKDFVILMIAELNKNKNHIQLIKSMELLKKRYSDIKVICVGEGDMLTELKHEVAIRRLKDNIMFFGFRTDINELINISDLGILLSYREGLPRNLMEFIACGRRVIATDIRGCRDIVCDESVGTLVKIGDIKRTARAIENYYLEYEKKFAISEQIQKYDVENIKDRLWDIYDKVEGGESFDKGMSAYLASR